MIFKAFTVVAGVSLLLGIGDVWLMVRRGRVVGEGHVLVNVYVRSRGGRYTLRAGAGGLVLGGPPVAAATRGYRRSPPYFVEDTRPLSEVLAGMRNEDVAWEFMHYESQKAGDERVTVEWSSAYGREVILRNNRLMEEDKGLLIPGLLEALEDPRRAVAAHRFLVARVGYSYWTLPRRPEGKFSMEFDGMKVDFMPLGERNVGVSGGLVDIDTPRGGTWIRDSSRGSARGGMGGWIGWWRRFRTVGPRGWRRCCRGFGWLSGGGAGAWGGVGGGRICV